MSQLFPLYNTYLKELLCMSLNNAGKALWISALVYIYSKRDDYFSVSTIRSLIQIHELYYWLQFFKHNLQNKDIKC